MKILVAVVALTSMLACSTVKDYHSTGEPNFTIQFKAGGAFLKSTDLNVSMFEYLPTCKIHYIGTVTISRNDSKKIALPVNRAIGVKTIFEQGGFFSNSEYSNSAMPFQYFFRSGIQYDLEVEEDNHAIGRNFFRREGNKRIELEPVRFYPKCEKFEDE